jgi:GntR family transcriptional regulator, transcriptional repressor for pyruvate dehydrogenase complex
VTPRTPWRMSHRVAEDLRRRILRGELDPGVRLPPLPALASELGISEHHLREALRLLEQDGLVRVASGRNGGVFVTPPEQAGLTRSFGLVLARAGALLSDLMEARADIEPVIAARAAVEATDEDPAKLESVLTTHADLGGPRPGINAEFHLAVAAASPPRDTQGNHCAGRRKSRGRHPSACPRLYGRNGGFGHRTPDVPHRGPPG